MTLQQLRFLIAVAESGSINAAAQRLYTAQSNISNAVKSLEQELHLEIFTRSSRGVTLTNDGTELLGYARQVVEQADMLEARYEDGGTPQARLAVSAQHYAFSVEAFVTSSSAAATASSSSSCARPPRRRSSTTSAHFAATSAFCILMTLRPCPAEGLRRCPCEFPPPLRRNGPRLRERAPPARTPPPAVACRSHALYALQL